MRIVSLQKTLGRTVDGFDEFIEGLLELKTRGIDITGVFELVDRRAAAVFSILLDGTETVKQFKERLSEASGVMERQAAIQLDSISYRAKLAKESWKAFMLELDSGDSVISKTVKGLLSLSDALLIGMGKPDVLIENTMHEILTQSTNIRRLYEENNVKLNLAQEEEYKDVLNKTRDYYSKLYAIQEHYNRKVEIVKNLYPGDASLTIGLKNELVKQYKLLEKEFPNIVGELAGERSLIIEKASKPYVDAFNELAKSSNSAYDAFELSIKNLIKAKKRALSANDIDQAEVFVKAINGIGDAYERISGLKLMTVSKNDGIAKLRKKLEYEKQVALELG